jgi:peptide/nickel transport system permease protein
LYIIARCSAPFPAVLHALYSYIVRRLPFGAQTVIGVSIIVFIVLRILPGDPLVAIFGAEGFTKLSEAERAHYMAELELIDPLVA